MKIVFPVLLSLSLLIISCGDDASDNSDANDSLSSKDSMKKTISEDLPTTVDITQFEWIYSTFAASAISDAPRFNVFIHKDHGLWIIRSNGAMPEMINVKSILGVMTSNGDSLVPMNREKMASTPSEDPMPIVDCDSKTHWSQDGCFTSETNTFLKDKIWDYAGLNESDEKKVQELGSGITRVVINTEMNMRFYFSEINGTWYLTFLDMRVPCEA